MQGILGLRTICKGTLSFSRRERPVLFCSGQSFFLWFMRTELPTDGIGIAHEPFEESTPQPIDILH